MHQITPHQRAALDYRTHISLTANAGSGKTFVLSRRYVEIALNEDISLRNIVAITFTEKAASELYKKISDEISGRLLVSNDFKEKRKLEKIRRQLVSANISTIHSFCIDLLREFPVEAQLDAGFIPIDNHLTNELIDLSIEEVIRNSLKDNESANDLKYLIRIFASRDTFAKALSSLIQKRKNILKLSNEIYSKTEDEISRFFHDTFEKNLSLILFKNRDKVIECIKVINHTVLVSKPDNPAAQEIEVLLKQLAAAAELKDVFQILEGLKNKLLTGTLKLRQQGYLKAGREGLKDQIDIIEEYFTDLDNFQLTYEDSSAELELARFGKKLVKIFNHTLSVYNSKKRQNGYLDFEDILIFSQQILCRPDVCKKLHEKYHYIMIDEYQDTNEIQYEIFMPILEYLRKGNLFIVGDEKQSIYMFRDAELNIFNRTKREISQICGQDSLLNLPDSFRMAPAICLFTNFIFRKHFSDPDPAYNEVGCNDLVCAKDEGTPGRVEILLAGKGRSTEAELVAAKILELQNGVQQMADTEKFNLDEIAILCRKRRSFEELEMVFSKYKIPYTIVGGKGFYQKQFVMDIFNYLQFLFNRDNDAALVGILRSPFFTLSDAEIFEISLCEKPNFWENLRAYSAKSAKIQEIVSILSENLLLVHEYDLTSLLRKIIREGSYISVLSSRPNGAQELANLEKLITVSGKFFETGYKTIYDFINYLENAINNVNDEEQASVAPENNSVKIMTVHQAKGLEYKAVFLYACHDHSQSDSVKAKSVSVDKDFGLLTSVPLNGNLFEDYKSAPIVLLHNFISKKKNLAEIKRLLYVGVTRAKNFLFISASHSGYKFHEESFMNLIIQAIQLRLPGEKAEINFDLSFLKAGEEGYSNYIRKMTLEIPVINDINNVPAVEPGQPSFALSGKKLMINNIEDTPEGEIISATKIAVYTQCPLKYYLTYELGYGKLFRYFKPDLISYDLKTREEEDNHLFTDIKGKVIHAVLEKELLPSQCGNMIAELIKNELSFSEATDENITALKNNISRDLDRYFNSKIFSELSSYAVYRNEFKIQCRESDYYLFGIIDRLIISDDRAIIVDFKSDEISAHEINGRAESYLPQLKFYAYLTGRLYPQINSIEVWLVFIRFPDEAVKITLSKGELEAIGIELNGVADRIRNRKFAGNLFHCSNCHYSHKNGKCIKS
ncbi:MAG: UvrD-helicase domain-containing protein [Ignavibacteriales bacterium]